jgi:hypothetical protein
MEELELCYLFSRAALPMVVVVAVMPCQEEDGKSGGERSEKRVKRRKHHIHRCYHISWRALWPPPSWYYPLSASLDLVHTNNPIYTRSLLLLPAA